jgi:hypothetical protein
MAVPYTFGTATSSIPLSQLDSNFNTVITLGNTAIQLGNTVTTLNNMTLANVTISSGNVTITNVAITTANVTTANITTAVIGTETVTTSTITTANVTTANITTNNITNGTVITSLTLSYGTANGVAFLNGSKVLTTGTALTFDGTNFATTGTATAAKLIPTGSSATGNGMYLPAANSVGISTNGTEAMRIDSSGNLLVGTTTANKKVTVYSPQSGLRLNHDFTGNVSYAELSFSSSGVAGNGAGIRSYRTSESFNGNEGDLRFYTNTGSGGASSDGTEAMRIDSSGNVGIGTSSVSTGAKLDIRGANSNDLADLGAQVLTLFDTTSYASGVGAGIAFGYKFNSGGSYIQRGAVIKVVKENGTDGNYASALVFGTTANAASTTEAMRIDSSGNLLVGPTSGTYHNLRKNLAADYCTVIENTSSTAGTNCLRLAIGTTGDATGTFIKAGDAGAFKFQVLSNGNVQNTNNSYGAISDIKLKENIIDATPKLAGLMQVKVRNYNLKSDPTHKQIGVVAQELEAIFPAMIEETPDKDTEGNDLGTTTKSVKYSVFVPMLIKAIQEQQALITSLTARITTLEST